jgi:hypothetical protein
MRSSSCGLLDCQVLGFEAGNANGRCDLRNLSGVDATCACKIGAGSSIGRQAKSAVFKTSA